MEAGLVVECWWKNVGMNVLIILKGRVQMRFDVRLTLVEVFKGDIWWLKQAEWVFESVCS